MTADLDLIRRAANQMRADDDERWHSVADWLDDEAESVANFERLGCSADQILALFPHAFAVARAFLKEDADV